MPMKHLSFPRLERVFTAIFIPPKYEEPRLENWKNRSDAILAFAAIIFLAAYAAPIINPDLSRMWHYMCRTVSNAVWLIFAVEYIVRIVMAQHRWSFIRYHLFDLAIVVLPFFQPLRLLRLVFLLRILNRRASSSLRGRIATYITFAAVLITFVGALAELDVERNAPDAQITTFADSLWWAFVTVTTVGYGDLTPVTEMGRLVA
ncbi:MAG: ion channel, partial [Actinomycetaceae bacterium]|nr:ion channel [Actinomycetaceae bacterium]